MPVGASEQEPYADLVADGHGEDWDAVAAAISNRLTETRMTQMDLASGASVSLTTVRELQHNLNPRKRRPQTLAAVSEALGWPAGYLGQVLRGEDAEPVEQERTDPVLSALGDLTQGLQDLRERVAAIEARLSDGDARP